MILRRRDLWLLGAAAAAVLALCASFLLAPGRTATNFGDVYAYHLPLRILAASRLQAGELPFWNPYIFGETPLLANPQAGLFYPLSVPFQLLPAADALDLSVALHLLLALLGAQLLLRRAGLPSSGAAALAAAYALSPYLVFRIPQGVPTLLYALAYVPWVWLLHDRRGPLALALSFQFLSGHPQFMAANLIGLGAFLAVFRPGRLPGFAAAGAAALLVCAPQLGPTVEFLSRSVRVGWSSVFQTGYSLPLEALLSFIYPGYRGSPLDGSFDAPPSIFFELLPQYLGLVPLALAAVGVRKGRRGGPLLLAAVGLFLALGEHNPLYRWVSMVPPFSLVRAPSRFSVLVLWAVLLAAAEGWRTFRWPRWEWKAAAFALVLADLLLWGFRFVGSEPLAAYMAPKLETVAPLRDPAYRVATAPELANPNKMMLYRLRNAAGYEAFYLGSAALYATRSLGRPAADASRLYLDSIENEGMEALAVRWLLGDKPRPGESGGGLRVRENPEARPLAYLEDGSPAALLELHDEEWIVGYRSSRPRFLVLSGAMHPGWRAWVDGRSAPVKLWRDFHRAVEVPAGEGVVHLRFRPRAWGLLLLLGLGGLGLLLLELRRSLA